MKISKSKEKQNGVTLTTLVVLVILIFIIAGTLIYNSLTGANVRRLNRMYNDIELLSDKVNTYYAKYSTIPIKYDGEDPIKVTFDISSDKKDVNDGEDDYYVLNLSDLSGVSLNYGKDYDDVTVSNISDKTDLYIINGKSHTIYYLNGVTFEGETYYTKDANQTKVSLDDSIKGRKYYADTTVTVGNYDVTIPAGFTVSGLDDEVDVGKGLVIYLIPDNVVVNWDSDESLTVEDGKTLVSVEEAKKTYDQFVWIPVENVVLDLSSEESLDEDTIKDKVEYEIANERYPMAIETGTDSNGNATYIGILYSLDESGNVTINSNWDPLSSTGYREPDSLTETDTKQNLSYVDGILNTKYSSLVTDKVACNAFKEDLQEDYNEMVESVSKNSGFWIGRYETSGMSNDTTNEYTETNEIEVSIVNSATEGINGVSWYKMYAQQKIYSSKANISKISSMIWGSQWDQVMIYMKDAENICDLDDENWTMECYATSSRVLRSEWTRKTEFSSDSGSRITIY